MSDMVLMGGVVGVGGWADLFYFLLTASELSAAQEALSVL